MMFTRAELMRATNPRSSGSASSNGLSRFGSVAARCAERDRLRSFAAARTLPADGESVFRGTIAVEGQRGRNIGRLKDEAWRLAVEDRRAGGTAAAAVDQPLAIALIGMARQPH